MLVCFGRAMTRFGDDRHGVTILEYAVIAAAIATVCVGAVSAIGTALPPIFAHAAGSL